MVEPISQNNSKIFIQTRRGQWFGSPIPEYPIKPSTRNLHNKDMFKHAGYIWS